MEIWMLGGDGRQTRAADFLPGLRTWGVPGRADSPLPEHFSRLILPLPAASGSLVRGTELPMEEVLRRLSPGSRVWGGALGPWAPAIGARGGTGEELLQKEPFATENAAFTAEAALALAVTGSPGALLGSACLILGFGRLGKVLAHRLRAFGCRVTVAARRAGDRALARSLGLAAAALPPEGLPSFSYIFNTVPARLLEDTAPLAPDCLVVDLAPGHESRRLADSLGERWLSAPGLPGRFCPRGAGEALGRCLREELQL